MHSTTYYKTFSLRLKPIALVAILLSGTNLEAGGLMPGLERVGRYMGVGYGDGYHVCRPEWVGPCADLPIARDQESCLTKGTFGNYGQPACDACGLPPEIVDCDGGSCFSSGRSGTECDQSSCDQGACDGPSYYANQPLPAYAQTVSSQPPEPQMPSVTASTAKAEIAPTVFVQTQATAESRLTGKSRFNPFNATSGTEPQVTTTRTRMTRPVEVETQLALPESAHENSTSPKRRPKRL
jgi:hypothetical protein